MLDTLLFVGDIHLGRRPERLAEAAAELGLSSRTLSPVAAWDSTVAHALEHGVRGLVLAGDVVDSSEDRFEAYGHLERGVRQLQQGDIPVYGVAGNHDSRVLPRLARQLGDGFHLLGAGGHWERLELEGPGQPVDLVGWSFPSPHHVQDPTAAPDFREVIANRRPEALALGVLHGDLGATTSRYAPLDADTLARSGLDGWLLGHVHRPHDLSGPPLLGYLGSLVGLDPGETGLHGPWEIDVGSGRPQARQVPLAPVRWEQLDVALDDGLEDAEAVQARIHSTLAAASVTWETSHLRLLVARIRLSGTTTAHAAARRFAEAHQPARDLLHLGSLPCVVDRIEVATRPAIDLEALAQEPSPAGWLAGRLLALERGEPDPLRSRASTLAEQLSTGRWQVPSPTPRIDEGLVAATWRALETLLDHRSAATGQA